MKFHLFNNINNYIKESLAAIEAVIGDALKERPVVRVALSGGTSPVPVYRALAESKNIPWNRVALFLVDERYVPLNSKSSNTKMISDTLVDHVKNLRRFYHYNPRDPIAIIVDQYQKTLRQFDSPLFDLVILGLGADGHTASLFPHESVLRETNRLVAHSFSPDPNTKDRMTLTFSAILDSRKIIFLVQGKDKKEAVDQLVSGNATVDDLPAKKIMEHPDVEVFYTP